MKKLALLFALVLLPGPAARADRLELKTGQVFTGKILRLTEDEVSIRLDSGGFMTFRLSGVRSVKRSSDEEGSVLLYGQDGEERDASLGPNGTILSTPKLKPDRGVDSAPLHVVRLGPVEVLPSGEGAGSRTETRAETVVKVPKHGFSIAPPRGFVPWPEGTTGGAILAYRDPATQSTFLVTTRVTSDELEKVKKAALRAYADQFASFHVVKDAALSDVDGDASSEGWRLEIETKSAGGSILQIQVFRKLRSQLLVVSYAAAIQHAENLREAFEESLQSFRFTSEEIQPSPRPVTVPDDDLPPSALGSPWQSWEPGS